MDCNSIMTEEVRLQILSRLEDSQGNEILIIGRVNEEGLLDRVHFAAMGSEDTVPALFSEMERGDIVLHNHPSGVLKPSGADLDAASRLGNSGIGFYIIDNACSRYYPVCEPSSSGAKINLDAVSVKAVLEPGGPLSKIFPGYEPRQAQIDMLEKIVNAFNHNGLLLVEAGTGVGKSFAYLIPAMLWALKNDERVVVSTATINLQHQLLEKDIPLVNKLLEEPVKAVLVKGRGNYLCRRRLREALEEDSLFREEDSPLERIKEWADGPGGGDRSELGFLPDPQQWSRVCSEVESCTGIRCPYHEECFFIRARKRALGAGLLVVNHHLLFSDLSLRMNGAGYEQAAVLPPFQRVIIDESHHMENTATSYFSRQISRPGLTKLLQRLYRKKKGIALGCFNTLVKMARTSDLDTIPKAVGRIQQKMTLLDTRMLPELEESTTVRFEEQNRDHYLDLYFDRMNELSKEFHQLADAIKALMEEIDEENRDSAEFFEAGMVRAQLAEWAVSCGKFLRTEEDDEHLFWIERKRFGEPPTIYVQWNITPVRVGPLLDKALYAPIDSVVLTSATLSIGGNFRFIEDRIGLREQDRLHEARLPSPFDYQKRVLLGIPQDAPLPTDDAYLDFVAETTRKAVLVSEGRALVLFTSYRMLDHVYEKMADGLEDQGIRVLKQGDHQRQRLMEMFKEDPTSVLLGTDSFWEGIDAPGDTLKLVIICRLPFRVPSHPVLKARLEEIERRGGNPFFQLSLPEAAMKLKQGFGRLMRTSTDGGAVLILDPRMIRKSYGRIFHQSLPPARAVQADTESLLELLQRQLYPPPG